VGTAFSKEKDFTTTVEYLTRALLVKPDLDILYSKRGIAKVRLGDLEGAKEDLEKSVRLNRSYAPNLAYLAKFYAMDTPHRNLILALELVTEASQNPMLTPSLQAVVRKAEGIVRMELGNYELAIGAFQVALALAPGDTECLFLLGIAYRKAGEEEKALNTFRDLLQLDPTHPGALEELKQK
jgi:Flp pilus assembly protein TadD